MFEKILENEKKRAPLVHCITNYVTVNDCANILLACGGSPIMADDGEEAAEITSICGGLCLNIGTLNRNTIPSMFLSGKKANELGIPAVLDPVGAGASALRTETALRLLRKIRFAVIRGNSSEIRTIAGGGGSTQGVDAALGDAVTEENLAQSADFVRELSRRTGSVISMTGAVDLVTDGKTAYAVRNGTPALSRISGTGCMLSAVTAAFCAANPGDPLRAAAAAVCAMGLCGERAERKMLETGAGNGTFRMLLLDEMSRLDIKTLEEGKKIEIL